MTHLTAYIDLIFPLRKLMLKTYEIRGNNVGFQFSLENINSLESYSQPNFQFFLALVDPLIVHSKYCMQKPQISIISNYPKDSKLDYTYSHYVNVIVAKSGISNWESQLVSTKRLECNGSSQLQWQPNRANILKERFISALATLKNNVHWIAGKNRSTDFSNRVRFQKRSWIAVGTADKHNRYSRKRDQE